MGRDRKYVRQRNELGFAHKTNNFIKEHVNSNIGNHPSGPIKKNQLQASMTEEAHEEARFTGKIATTLGYVMVMTKLTLPGSH